MNSKPEPRLDLLERSTYPGRGIAIGMTPDANHMVQVYWIMGRSPSSRNRVFVEEADGVRTDTVDKSAPVDPLTMYYPVRSVGNCHIVTNGDQTDTIYVAIQLGSTFESALNTRTFEPDKPNYTPRISGVVDLGSNSEPTHIAFSHFDCSNIQCRLVDLERLLVTVKDELGQAERGMTTELKQRLGKGVNTDLLRRMSLNWGVPPKRGFYRNTKSAQVEVVVGMTAVHRALGLVTALRSMTASAPIADSGPEGLFSKTSTFSTRVVKSENDQKEDIWEMYKKPSAAKPVPKAAEKTEAKRRRPPSPPPRNPRKPSRKPRRCRCRPGRCAMRARAATGLPATARTPSASRSAT